MSNEQHIKNSNQIMKNLVFKKINDSSSSSPLLSASSSNSSPTSSIMRDSNMKNDLGSLIKDLKLACGDLFLLIKQIDYIANRFEEKFITLITTTNQQQELNSNEKKLSPETVQSIYSIQTSYSDREICNNRVKKKSKQQSTQIQNDESTMRKSPNSIKNLYKNNTSDSSSSKESSSSISADSPLLNKSNTFEAKKNYEQDLLWFVNNNTKRSRSQPVIKDENQRRPRSLFIQKVDSIENLDEYAPSLAKNKQDTSVMDSSFYEDKLDNELECDLGAALETVNDYDKSNVKYTTYENSSLNLHEKHSKKVTQIKTKTTNNSHHVCFNLNNTIYNTKQDAPIPIIIQKEEIKQQNKCSPKKLFTFTNNRKNSSASNSLSDSTMKSLNETFNSMRIKHSQNTDMIIKQSCTDSDESAKLNNSKSSNASIRSETKTTLL